MRARIRRRERKRRLAYAGAIAVAAVLVVLVVYEATLPREQNPIIGEPLSAQDSQELYRIATSPNYGPNDSSLVASPYVVVNGGQQWYLNSRPVVLYIGAEYCGPCAFMRWPLIMALMRFGNFTGLSYMQSSGGQYPNADTFSFYGSTYSSQYLIFQPVETQTRNQGTTLQTVPSNYTSVFNSYGAKIPFIDVANKYIVGTFFQPQYLGGGLQGNWTLDIQAIGRNTTLGYQVMSSANLITELICSLTAGKPSSVCNNPALAAYASFVIPTSYSSSPGGGLASAYSSSYAQMKLSTQYRRHAADS